MRSCAFSRCGCDIDRRPRYLPPKPRNLCAHQRKLWSWAHARGGKCSWWHIYGAGALRPHRHPNRSHSAVSWCKPGDVPFSHYSPILTRLFRSATLSFSEFSTNLQNYQPVIRWNGVLTSHPMATDWNEGTGEGAPCPHAALMVSSCRKQWIPENRVGPR